MGLFSSKKSSTTNTTQNTFNDNRSVVDAGGGIVGEGNSWDQSVNLVDASQRTTTVNTVDGGAIALAGDLAQLQLDATREISRAGTEASNDAFDLAERAQIGAMTFNENAASRVFDLASSSQARAFDSSAEALGFTRDTFTDVLGLAGKVVDQAGSQAREASTVAAGAYSSAADTSSGNKTLIYAGLAVVGLVGAAFLFKR